MRSEARALALAVAALAAYFVILCTPTVAATSEDLESIFRGLSSSDPQTVEQAEGQLREAWMELWKRDIGPELPKLAELLRSNSSEVREYAALTLAGAAVNNVESAHSLQSISATLVDALADPDPEVRQAVVAAVAQMRPTPPTEATSSLLDLLDASQEDTRAAALGALVRIRPVPEELQDVLIDQVRQSSSLMPYAIRALGGMSIDDPDVVRLVVDQLGSADPAVRVEAVQALSHWGSTARPALPRLREIAADPRQDETLRMLARGAIERISGQELEP